jgi:ABC-2 type transport system permease protein
MSKAVSGTPVTPKNTLAGYGKYLRFTLRHNLVRYLVWIAVTVFLVAYVGVYYKSMFDTQAKLDEFASVGSSPGMVAMIGKISCMATIGGAVWTKIWMFTALTLGIGMVFQVTKGARADEENGRTEVFRSRPFGIHSTLASVVSGALILCLVIGILSTLACIGLNLDPAGTGITGSVIFGLSITAIGWLGVGVGALTNQLSASASLANSTGSIVIVVFYCMRMIGDMGSNDTLTWLSPIGWGEKMAPWAGNRGWLIIPVIVLTAALIAAAFVIEAHRDYGSGVLRDKKGKSEAKPLMRRSWGLILHLYKGSIIGWSIGIVLAGLMFGSVANSMLSLFSDAAVPMLKGSGIEALMGLLLCFIGLVSVVLPMLIMTGLRSDEARGLTEAQLAGGISRGRIILERFAVGTVATALLLILGGASFGLSYGTVANDMSQIWKLAIDSLIYLPGIMAVMGVIVLLFGLIPRATIPVTWFIYGAMYFDVLLSDALKLPKWAANIMPFIGTPRIPYQDFDASVFGYLAAAIIFVLLGMIGLYKRDVPR